MLVLIGRGARRASLRCTCSDCFCTSYDLVARNRSDAPRRDRDGSKGTVRRGNGGFSTECELWVIQIPRYSVSFAARSSPKSISAVLYLPRSRGCSAFGSPKLILVSCPLTTHSISLDNSSSPL